MRKLLIPAVLFAIIQALAPIPGQTPNTGGGNTQGSANSGAGGKNPTVTIPLPFLREGPASKSGKDSGKQDKTTNDDKSIIVRKFPSVSVNKDWSDWTALGLNAILVCVGIGGVVVGFCTLGWLKKQTTELVNATKATRDSANATKDSAEATGRSVDAFLNAERAWVIVNTISSDGPFVPKLPSVHCTITIKNAGRTTARIVSTKHQFIYVDAEKMEQMPWEPSYPQRRKSGDSRDRDLIDHSVVLVPNEVSTDLWFCRELKEGQLERIRSGKEDLYISVLITYYSIGPEPHDLQFCYQYTEGHYPPPEPGKFWRRTFVPKAYNRQT